jgi:hypothetical protein
MVISYNFGGLTNQSLLALQADLQTQAAGSNFNVFFNRPGAL